ncbi:7627_t:CDS:2 [Dentiscutata erythropus]|uniref:7627_t:CDS:1 n=1 Tax=Dentiscutata erythropus TaxID=1348616 RepID=A0A9N9C9C6_9GLOM|nr:7627_t:CDS:2 [Dentiscutata erythropus]
MPVAYDEYDKYDEEPSNEKYGQDDSSSDKQNTEIILQNPKKRCNRGRPLCTK